MTKDITTISEDKRMKLAIAIANNIGSPWGEGATYDSIFDGKSPKLDIKQEFGCSHLDDDDWKLLVEDIVNIINGGEL